VPSSYGLWVLSERLLLDIQEVRRIDGHLISSLNIKLFIEAVVASINSIHLMKGNE
jgi:hypothetical protein